MDVTGDYTVGLISKIREGSTPHLEEFLARYGSKLLIFINYKLGKRLRGKVEPEDVLQDFCLSLVEDRDRFLDKVDHRGVQRTLYRLLENRIKDLYEHFFQTQKRDAGREVRERREPDGGGFSFSQVAASTATFVKRVEAEDEYRRLARILEELDEDSQQLFILKFVEECTNQDMAERLGVSVSTVKRQTAELIQKVQLARKRAADD